MTRGRCGGAIAVWPRHSSAWRLRTRHCATLGPRIRGGERVCVVCGCVGVACCGARRPELAMCLLSEVAFACDEEFKGCLPLMLHACVVLLDAGERALALPFLAQHPNLSPFEFAPWVEGQEGRTGRPKAQALHRARMREKAPGNVRRVCDGHHRHAGASAVACHRVAAGAHARVGAPHGAGALGGQLLPRARAGRGQALRHGAGEGLRGSCSGRGRRWEGLRAAPLAAKLCTRASGGAAHAHRLRLATRIASLRLPLGRCRA